MKTYKGLEKGLKRQKISLMAASKLKLLQNGIQMKVG